MDWPVDLSTVDVPVAKQTKNKNKKFRGRIAEAEVGVERGVTGRGHCWRGGDLGAEED